MRRQDARKQLLGWIAVAVAVAGIAGCGGKHYLSQYQFSGRTLGLEYVDPPAPQLLHGYYDLKVPKNVREVVTHGGGAVAKEVAARRATARLDSAVAHVDVASGLAKRTVERASRYLGTRPSAAGEADYLLEVTMRSFGLDARSSSAAYLFTRAEAVLLDRQTGREIWSIRVRGSNRLTPWVRGTQDVPATIITAGTLHTVSVEDFETALDQLVTYTSNLIAEELRAKLRDVRDK